MSDIILSQSERLIFMIKVCFVCHGNICRSTTAEMIMRHLCDKEGLNYKIDSCGTSREEIGCPVYPPSASVLRQHHIPIVNHKARQITLKDAEEFDLLVGMDTANIYNMKRMLPEKYHSKIMMLNDTSVEDPWYSENYEKVYQQIYAGCVRLLDQLTKS